MRNVDRMQRKSSVPRRRPLRNQSEPTPYQPDRGADPIRRSHIQFACPQGHAFSLAFAAIAQPPNLWTCPRHGIERCRRVNGSSDETVQTKPKRTHLMILLERRNVAELD